MPKLTSSLSIAGAAGGFASIAFTFVYAFTHGTTTVNKMESLFGMNELEWGQIGAIVPLLRVISEIPPFFIDLRTEYQSPLVGLSIIPMLWVGGIISEISFLNRDTGIFVELYRFNMIWKWSREHERD